MKDEILKIIQEIQQKKQMDCKYPSCALKMEVLQLMRERFEKALTELTEEGKLLTGNTINQSYYQTT